jgi:predicted  nucleic acid-binding Zn-ribbon protein
LGTVRSLEATVQGFEERAVRLETDIADVRKRAKELETKVGAPFEKEEHYQHLCRRQSEIEDKLDLTKNQAPSQIEAEPTESPAQKLSERRKKIQSTQPARHAAIHV